MVLMSLVGLAFFAAYLGQSVISFLVAAATLLGGGGVFVWGRKTQLKASERQDAD